MNEKEKKESLQAQFNAFRRKKLVEYSTNANKVHQFHSKIYDMLAEGETDFRKSLKENVEDLFAEAGRSICISSIFLPYCLKQGITMDEITEFTKNVDNPSKELTDKFTSKIAGFKEWIFNKDKAARLETAKDIYTTFFKTMIDEAPDLSTRMNTDLNDYLLRGSLFYNSQSSLAQTLTEKDAYKGATEIEKHVNKELKSMYNIDDGFEKMRNIGCMHHQLCDAVKGTIKPDHLENTLFAKEYALYQSVKHLKGESLKLISPKDGLNNALYPEIIDDMTNVLGKTMQYLSDEEANIGIKAFNEIYNDRMMKDCLSICDPKELLDMMSEKTKSYSLTGDSKEYTAIKNTLQEMVLCDPTESNYKENYQKLCNDLVKNCNNYLDNRNPWTQAGKERYGVVSLVKEFAMGKSAQYTVDEDVVDFMKQFPKKKYLRDDLAFQKRALEDRIDELAAKLKDAPEKDRTNYIAEIITANTCINSLVTNPKYNKVNKKDFNAAINKLSEDPSIIEMSKNFDPTKDYKVTTDHGKNFFTEYVATAKTVRSRELNDDGNLIIDNIGVTVTTEKLETELENMVAKPSSSVPSFEM